MLHKIVRNELLINLGPILNLHQRIVNEDSPRSIALAKRTFMRSTINSEKILGLVQTDDIVSLTNSLNTIISLQKNSHLNTQEFVQAVEALLTFI